MNKLHQLSPAVNLNDEIDQGDQTEFGIKFQIFNEKTPKKHQI